MRGTEFAEMEAFVAVAERKSFVKAAVHLGVSRSTLSQNVRSLEERLGVRLLNRTTRSVAATEAGQRLLARSRLALAELSAAVEEVNDFRNKPTGLLRIVVQPPVATFLIGPLMARFLARFPSIRLDVSIYKVPPDIVSEGFDAGIRIGEQVERDMIAIRVTDGAQFVVVASPEYLASHPAPKTPPDLRSHNCIRARLPNGAIFGWEFARRRKALQVAVAGSLIVDDIDLAIRGMLDGIGVGYLLHDYVARYIAEGRLVPLLRDWSPRLSGFSLYHPSRRQVTAPLRALIDFLAVEARPKPGRRPAPPSGNGKRSGYRLGRGRRRG